MKYINIFVAGSKTLHVYRDKLVLWANGKNYDFRRKQADIQINVYSFVEVGDDQDLYNKVITEDSDIALCIVEGIIHEKTKEELLYAKSALNRKGHPELWVFTKDADVNTQAFLEGALGRKYSVDFVSTEDFINQVSKRVSNYIDNIIGFQKQSQTKIVKTQIHKKIGIAVLILLCLSFIGMFVFGVVRPKVEESPSMLLIAGGGSVANFIEEQPDTEIPSLANYENGYFLHLPTKSAWNMLVEEVVSLQDKRRYYPVCISAVEATDEDFLNAQITQKMYIDSAIIVSCKLGEDSLAVYIPKDCEFLKENENCKNSGHISVPQLKNLLLTKEMNVYSTSYQSGTRAGYCKILEIKNEDLNEYLAGQFSESSPMTSVDQNKKPYLLLGSQYYQMKAVKSDALMLTVQSDYVKPMLIYFMAYNAKNDLYKIPKETLSFMHHLRIHELDDYISKDGTIKIKNKDQVIYDKRNLLNNASK